MEFERRLASGCILARVREAFAHPSARKIPQKNTPVTIPFAPPAPENLLGRVHFSNENSV